MQDVIGLLTQGSEYAVACGSANVWSVSGATKREQLAPT